MVITKDHGQLPGLGGALITRVKTTDAVWPDEPTVITGMYVPGLVDELATSVSNPDGFDSDSL
jgi:hypothetical protein